MKTIFFWFLSNHRVVKVVGAAVGAFFLVIIGAAVVKWLDETCNTRAS